MVIVVLFQVSSKVTWHNHFGLTPSHLHFDHGDRWPRLREQPPRMPPHVPNGYRCALSVVVATKWLAADEGLIPGFWSFVMDIKAEFKILEMDVSATGTGAGAPPTLGGDCLSTLSLWMAPPFTGVTTVNADDCEVVVVSLATPPSLAWCCNCWAAAWMCALWVLFCEMMEVMAAAKAAVKSGWVVMADTESANACWGISLKSWELVWIG